jgi:hypothetical protein
VRNSIVGNRCYDPQATKTQRYGINLTGGTDSTLVAANSCQNNKSGTVINGSTGTANVFRNNLGSTIDAGGDGYAINAQTGTTYTGVLTDAQKLVTLNNAAAITVTHPLNSAVAYPIGTRILWAQTGSGQVTFATGGGVTVSARGGAMKIVGQYGVAESVKIATDTWLLVGDLTA